MATLPVPPARSAAVGSRRLLHAFRWWGSAALALAAGFADLWRGGVVVAPALLVLAYVVLVPLAVLRR